MKQWFMHVLLIGGLALLPPAAGAQNKTLSLCADARDWYPFTYQDNGEAKGLHIDIVKQALTQLGYDLNIQLYPRLRCVRNVRNNDMAGMISLEYDPEMATFLEYPADAAQASESSARIMQVDHVVVTYGSDAYEFEGDLRTMPDPVRVIAGESIIGKLQQAGVRSEDVTTDLQNFRKLMRDRKGVVVTTSLMAEKINRQPEFKGKFKISMEPLVSQSYHLAFSKNAELTAEEKQRIWAEIAKLRDDYVYMLQIFAQY